jgi:hypothetical protein
VHCANGVYRLGLAHHIDWNVMVALSQIVRGLDFANQQIKIFGEKLAPKSASSRKFE